MPKQFHIYQIFLNFWLARWKQSDHGLELEIKF